MMKEMSMKKGATRALVAAGVASLCAMPQALAAPQDVAETQDVSASAPTAPEKHTSVYKTGTIVVTASGYAEQMRFAPASISVIRADEIEKRGYTDLRQVLSMTEGVDTVGATGRFDTPAISIRGMSDAHTLILVDGVAQSGPGIAGGMMRSFNQLANTSLPAPAQIERIEVVRGPMSTLYGSDAMGGVINIITKKVTDAFQGSVSVAHLFETTKDKEDTTKFSFNAAGPITRDRVGMQLRGSYLTRGASSFGIDKEKRDYDNWNLGTRLTYTPAVGHSYYLDVDRGQNMRAGDFAQRMTMVSPFGSTIHVEPKGTMAQRFDRTKIVLGAENKVGPGTWTNTLSFLRNEMHMDADLAATVRPIFFITVPMASTIRNRVKNDFFTYDTKYDVQLGDAHHLVVGTRLQRESVDYHLRRKLTAHTALPPILDRARKASSDDRGSLSRTSWALFGEDTWTIAPKLDMTYGLRWNHAGDYADNVSPRAYLVYTPDKYFVIKGGVATGYKAPTMLQSSPVDVHLNMTGEIYRGSSALRPEHSTTEEVGLYYTNGRHKTDAHLTFFHTAFRNKIELGDAVTIAGVGDVRTYENIGRARIHGVEFGTKFAVAPKVTATANWTFLTSQIKNGAHAGQPLRSTPKQAVNVQLDWMPTAATDVWLSAQYRSGMYRSTQAAGLSRTYRPFTVLNMGITHKLRDNLRVQLAVNNLLNRDFDRTTAVGGTRYHDYYDDLDADGVAGGSYMSRRSYWLGLTYDF